MDGALQAFGDIALQQASAPRLGGNLSSMGAKNIDKASKDFEGMFMTQMLQPMFEGIKPDELFGGGHGEEVMRSFMLQEYGKIIAKNGHLGIADAVKSEMIRAQQIKDSGPTAAAGGQNAPIQ